MSGAPRWLLVILMGSSAVPTAGAAPPEREADVDVILVPQRAFPVAHLTLSFRAGPAFDPPGKAGLTELTNRMLLRGTQVRGRNDLEEAIEALGTELMTTTQRYSVGLGASVLSRNLPAFVALLTEVLTQPAFEPGEVDKVRREMLAELENDLDDDASLARTWFRRQHFGEHAFAHGTHGTATTLAALTADDVRAHAARVYNRANLVVGSSGAVERPELDALLAPLLAALPQGQAFDWSGFEAPKVAEGKRILLLDKPDRSQVQIILGHGTIDANHPDWPALHVALVGFGGTFTARLMQEVRVKRGLSYGAYARLAAERVGGNVVLTAAPESTDAVATTELLFSEYAKFVNEGLTDEEVDFARDYLLRAFAFALETPASRAAQRVRAKLLGWPDDVIEWWPRTLAAVTPDQARAAARKHLSPENLTVVVVCSAPDLRAAFAALPGATVQVRAFNEPD